MKRFMQRPAMEKEEDQEDQKGAAGDDAEKEQAMATGQGEQVEEPSQSSSMYAPTLKMGGQEKKEEDVREG